MADQVQNRFPVGAAHSLRERYLPPILGLVGLALLAVGITALKTRHSGMKWPVAVPEVLTAGGGLLVVGSLCFPCQRWRRRNLEVAFLQDAQSGDLPRVEQALARGVTVDVVDQYGETALVKAVAAGRVAVVRRLVEAGADLQARNQHGVPMLALAAAQRAQDGGDPSGTVAYLLERNPNPGVAMLNAALLATVRGGDPDTVQLLIDAGATVNAQISELDETALHCAVLVGRVDMARLLLDAGADVNARLPGSRFGNQTPLMRAIVHAQSVDLLAMIMLLISAPNFDPTVRNDRGQTALDVARQMVAMQTARETQAPRDTTTQVHAQAALDRAQRIERMIAARTPTAVAGTAN